MIVDEAWGGHLRFHPDLPLSAIEAGADVAVQSTHKLAGGLQQTGLIHWREGRVDSELMEEAYREYVTTSPSYHLLASADAAVRTLAAQGEQELGTRDRAHARAQGGAARARCPTSTSSTTRPGSSEFAEHAAGMDLVKTTLGLARYELSGYDVAQRARRARDRDREGRRQHDHADHDLPARAPTPCAQTVDALTRRALGPRVRPDGARRDPPANPFRAIDDRPVMHPYAARRYSKSIGREVPLREAVGSVAAESIEVYPPGVPLVLEGFRVSQDAVDYLLAARDEGGSIVARDTRCATLRVL